MRHNEELLQIGIAMFKKACSDAECVRQPKGPNMWSGTTCEGGGWKVRHTMNEDAMTPAKVAEECDLRSILKPAKAAYGAEILAQAQRYLNS